MTPEVSEGTIPFEVQGETLHTWYKVFGDVSARAPPPLVALHGGPGVSHDYLLPLSDIASFSEPRAVILYDQMGTGRSTHLPRKSRKFWTIDLFIDELINLLSYFGIESDFDLLGHSWGGILASEFVIRRQPSGLRRLILSNTLASARLRNISVARLRKQLPDNVQAVLREYEAAGDTSSAEYKAAMSKYREQFMCRVKPMPEPVRYALEQTEKDPTVYSAMSQGEVDENWDISDKVHLIQVPTLLINGEYDFEADDVCAPFFRSIAKVKWVKFTESSHMPHWEEREKYMQVVDSFLRDV